MELSEMAHGQDGDVIPCIHQGTAQGGYQGETTSRVAVLEKKLVSSKVISTVMATKSRGL